MTGRSETETSREGGDRASGRLMRTIRHPVALLLAAITVAYLPVLTTGTFFARDLMLQYVPARAFLAASLADGHIPLWNPLLHGGQPFLANPQNLLTYPPWIASFVLPLLTGLNLLIVLHIVLAALSTWWLGRSLGLSRSAAFVAAFGFSFCGAFVSLASLTHMLFTLAWLPLMAVTFIRLRSAPNARRIAAAGLSGGMCILAGGAEMILVSFLTLGCLFIGTWSERKGRARGLAMLVAVVAIAASIGTVRIWTTLDYLPETSRGDRQAFSELVRFSVPPERLPELIAPGFMGSTKGIVLSKYWGRELEQSVPYLFSIHFGAGLLLLALTGLTSGVLPRSMRIILGLLAVGSILLSLGRFLPGFEVAASIPFVSRFRYPIKIITMAALPMALLAGAGLDALAAMSVSTRRRLALVSGICGGLLLVLPVVTLQSFGSRLWSGWFRTPLSDQELAGLAVSLAIPAVVLVLLAIVFSQAMMHGVIVAGLVCLELFVSAQSVNSVAPRSIFDEPPHLALIRETTGDGYFQRVRPERSRVDSADDSDIWFARWTMESYELYSAYLWQVPQVLHSDFDGLAPLRVIALRDSAASGDAHLVRTILGISAVRAILMNDLVDAPDLELARTFRGLGGNMLFLYEHETAGRVRFVTEPWFATSKLEAEEMLARREFDPDRNAVIEADARPIASCEDPDSETSYERVSPNEVKIQVTTSCEGYLVIAETDTSGWTTTVDGEPATALRANVAFTGVFLTPGSHEVTRRYEPRGLTAAATVSGASLVAMLLFLIAGGRRRRAHNGDPAQS